MFKSKKYLFSLLAALLVFSMIFLAYQAVRASCSSCGDGNKNNSGDNSVYGNAISDSQVLTIKTLEAKNSDYSGKTVKVEGEIVKLCPSGCWFNLDDGTGVIHVSLNPESFVMPQDSLNSKVLVEGTFDYEDDYASIYAAGVKVLEK